MLTYHVQIAAEAAADIQDTVDFIEQKSPQNARKWAAELHVLVRDLGDLPHRSGVAREGTYRGRQLRQAIHYSHRVLYTVDDDEKVVTIVTVIHSSRDRWLR